MNKASIILTTSLTVLPGYAHNRLELPNIIFFLVDDMGWQDTSVPFSIERTMLNDRYHTPNMERLVKSGMMFTQAYACPLCSPTRVSLMTGMNAARHHVTNWTLRKDVSPDNPHPVMEAASWNVNGMSPEKGIPGTCYAKALPQYLREAGYTTIHTGKAHWGAKGTPGEDPRNLGFDINIGGHAAGGPGSYYGKYNFSAAWRNEDRIWDVPSLEKYHGQEIYLTEALTREAMTAMEQAVTRKAPFYLYLSHYAVHAPWEKDERFYQKYKDSGLTEMEASYASMLEGMDKSLGDVLEKVKVLGIEENTIIIFMSDNGSPSQCPRNLPLRGYKITPYEGGIRDPLIVRWPGITKQGSVCGEPVIIEDFFPTILAMAGIDNVFQPGGQIDGISFVPQLMGKKVNTKSRKFIWHFPHTYDQPPYSVIRIGDWKLIHWYLDGKEELYHLPGDIGESHDLSGAEPRRTRSLARELGEYLRSAGAKTPLNKSTGAPCPYPGE